MCLTLKKYFSCFSYSFPTVHTAHRLKDTKYIQEDNTLIQVPSSSRQYVYRLTSSIMFNHPTRPGSALLYKMKGSSREDGDHLHRWERSSGLDCVTSDAALTRYRDWLVSEKELSYVLRRLIHLIFTICKWYWWCVALSFSIWYFTLQNLWKESFQRDSFTKVFFGCL